MQKHPLRACQPDGHPPIELEDSSPLEPGSLELDDEQLDVFLPDDEQEPQPEQGDFWIEKV